MWTWKETKRAGCRATPGEPPAAADTADDDATPAAAPPKTPSKRLISLRLDPEVIDHFRATGPGWQTRMNDALRRAAGL